MRWDDFREKTARCYHSPAFPSTRTRSQITGPRGILPPILAASPGRLKGNARGGGVPATAPGSPSPRQVAVLAVCRTGGMASVWAW